MPAPLDVWDNGSLQVTALHKELLVEAKLLTFSSIWTAALQGELVRDLRPHRFTSKVSLPGGNVFVKCHGPVPWGERFRSWGRWRPVRWGALGEWNAIHAFEELGIPTLTAVAFGQFNGCSLLVTKAIEQHEELPRLVLSGAFSTQQTAQLSLQIAHVARTLHQQGWRHQDFYLDHFLVPVPETDSHNELSARLIDLHRAERSLPFPDSWRVKDLAQLHFSARGISATQRLRWFKAYLGTNKLSANNRELAGRVLAKSKAIATRAHRDGAVIDTALAKRRQA